MAYLQISIIVNTGPDSAQKLNPDPPERNYRTLNNSRKNKSKNSKLLLLQTTTILKSLKLHVVIL